MQSRLLINIVLLLVVTGLALFLIYPPEQPPESKDILLTSLDPAEIDRITIRQPGGNEIEFRKNNNEWRMQQPYALTANPARINALLKLPAAHSYTQFRREEPDLARFRLDAPVVSIRFNDTEIAFGDSSPIGEQRYVLVNETVHLINDSLFEQLQAPATFFLGTLLLPADSKIQAIIFPQQTIHRQNELWTAAPAADISADRIIKTVHAWQNLDAVSLREYTPDSNQDTIRVDLGSAGTIDFAIVSPPPQLILGRADLGLQYHISGYDAEQLFLSPGTSH